MRWILEDGKGVKGTTRITWLKGMTCSFAQQLMEGFQVRMNGKVVRRMETPPTSSSTSKMWEDKEEGVVRQTAEERQVA